MLPGRDRSMSIKVTRAVELPSQRRFRRQSIQSRQFGQATRPGVRVNRPTFTSDRRSHSGKVWNWDRESEVHVEGDDSERITIGNITTVPSISSRQKISNEAIGGQVCYRYPLGKTQIDSIQSCSTDL